MLADDVRLLLQRDAGSVGEDLEGFEEGDVLVFLNKLDHITVFLTGPTAIALTARVDVEGGAVVVVERSKPLVSRPGRA